MSPTISSDKKVPKTVQTAAAGAAGFFEILIFHPFDTLSKRFASNTTSLRSPNGMFETMNNINKVAFKDKAQDPALQRYRSLYPKGSVSAAFAYKILQRSWKMGGQPIVRDSMNKHGVGKKMQDTFGQRGGKIMTDSVAGMMMGIGEIVLLPLDRLKILAQTNPEALRGRGIIDICIKENVSLYAGAGVTALRNAPGSFLLFGGTAFTKHVIFRLGESSEASVTQNMMASFVGASLSIAGTNPQDVIKTRIQNKKFGEKHSSSQILRAIMREEGMTAFFKGLTPKITAAAPKLVFAYTATEFFVSKFMGTRIAAPAAEGKK